MGREFESYFFAATWVIAVVRPFKIADVINEIRKTTRRYGLAELCLGCRRCGPYRYERSPHKYALSLDRRLFAKLRNSCLA